MRLFVCVYLSVCQLKVGRSARDFIVSIRLKKAHEGEKLCYCDVSLREY